MKVIQVISEWKKRPTKAMQSKNGHVGVGQKMVQAIVEVRGQRFTRHLVLKA